MKLWCHSHISSVRPFDMPFVRHDHVLNYLRNMRQLIARVDGFRRMSDFESICIKWSYDRIYPVYDAPDWR